MRKTRLNKDLKKENAAKRLQKDKTRKQRRKQDKDFKNGVCKSLYSGTFKIREGVFNCPDCFGKKVTFGKRPQCDRLITNKKITGKLKGK